MREKAVLGELLQPPIVIPAGSDIVRQHSSPQYSTLILDGFAARYVMLMNGSRQITELNVPGDFVDLHSLMMSPMIAQLRSAELVKWTGRAIEICDWDDLVRQAEFDPTYLRLTRAPV